MCGIAGFSNFRMNYKEEAGKWYAVLQQMNRKQRHRGPDEEGVCLQRHCGLAHVRLSILDLKSGQQPMTAIYAGHKVSIVFNGEIYNMKSLREALILEGAEFRTASDTEVILMGYLLHGIDYVKEFNGIFAFAVWDESLGKLFLCRDRMGVKPLFYTLKENTLIFSSELKGILSYPDMEAVIDREGLCEILGLGPAKSYGKGVFKNIRELLPGYYLEFHDGILHTRAYWQLESHPHEDSWEQTVEKTRYLVTDAIKLQMLSDVPICTFLSGGVDSSLVTAVCSRELQKQGKQLTTYSFDFKDNDINFKGNEFQPFQDRPWVDMMVKHLDTAHQYLECCNKDLYAYLFTAVDARDLPGMADVEASMLYFCEKVALENKVTLTGECADEIFGGYPWFHKRECFEAECFPWSMDFTTRTMLLKEDMANQLPLEEYARGAYHKTISETPVLHGESAEEKRRREISYLNLKWFMQTLLDRMDRTSMHVGLEARVPFADHRIVEYLWNVPWSMKCKDGVVKGLLRAAAGDYLPKEVLYRKKSPYPKTYDPAYETLLRGEIVRVLERKDAPLNRLLDGRKVKAFLQCPSDYGKPFYGQLMAGPQLLGYLLQINYWLEKYHIRLEI